MGMRNKITFVVLLLAFISVSASAQQCDSIAAASYGGWQPVKTAPRDGTTVEMMETYGVAPWYGLFKWIRRETEIKSTDGKVYHFKDKEPSWVSLEDPNKGVVEDSCLFWRPYKRVGTYVDPTGGAQKSVAYWCAAMHLRYNKKKDACEKQ